ncbi:MAG TPA: GAP family protein, partial [Usitatibacter sp.]|nr:GAP family protein [Usitatibacter sp.]
GGLGLTLVVGVLAAIVLGGSTASMPSSANPKEWVSIVNIVAGCTILGFVAVALLRPANPERTAANLARISALDSAPATTIVLAGAVLANAGLFMVVALKDISQLDPTRLRYILDWTLFALLSLLPLGLGLVMLRFAPGRAMPVLTRARAWIERRARPLAFGVMTLLAATLLRDGITALLA